MHGLLNVKLGYLVPVYIHVFVYDSCLELKLVENLQMTAKGCVLCVIVNTDRYDSKYEFFF